MNKSLPDISITTVLFSKSIRVYKFGVRVCFTGSLYYKPLETEMKCHYGEQSHHSICQKNATTLTALQRLFIYLFAEKSNADII